jgi:hypothetical protein
MQALRTDEVVIEDPSTDAKAFAFVKNKGLTFPPTIREGMKTVDGE